MIEKLVESAPDPIKSLPFIVQYKNRFATPKIWGEKEVCYFANFGQAHFEKWDGNSLSKGLGGSETAVIRLAEEWTKLGYNVTVYGDPEKEVTINGVHYVPFFKFNQKDVFNIFIQWRHGSMASRVTCKKFYVDLHDVTHSSTFIDSIDSIDKIFVKSEFHASQLVDLPKEKIEVISNGI